MPVFITKSESRPKKITFLKNAKAYFITLADRAANWTPWVSKEDIENAISFEDLEQAGAVNPFQVPKKKRKKKADGIDELEAHGRAAKASEMLPSGKGLWLGFSLQPKSKDKLAAIEVDGTKQKKNDLHITLRYFGETDDKKQVQAVKDALLKVPLDTKYSLEPTGFDVFANSVVVARYQNQAVSDLHTRINEQIKVDGLDYPETYRTYKPHVSLSESDKPKKPKGKPPAITTQGLSLRWGGELVHQFTNKAKGSTKMAGEYIQAILAPMDGDLSELKEILGEEQFAKFTADNAQKFEGGVKYVLAEEEHFSELDAADLNDHYKAIFGPLRNAEKADAYIAMPTPGRIGWDGTPKPHVSFQEILREKTSALQSTIRSAIELSPDNPNWADIEAKANEAVSGFQSWLTDAFATLKARSAKSDNDIPPKPKFTDRLRNLFMGSEPANKGDGSMTPEEIKDLIEGSVSDAAEKAANVAIEKMIEKAELEEAEKADSEAQAEAAEKAAERDKKLDEALEFIAAQKAEKEEADKARANGEDPEAAQKAEIEQLQAKYAELEQELKDTAAKMDAVNRTPGRTSTETGKKPVPGAEKFDPADPYACFDTMGVVGRA